MFARLPGLANRLRTATRGGLSASKDFPSSFRSPILIVSISLVTGFAIGRWSTASDNSAPPQRALPNGLPRTCCDEDLTELQRVLPARLARIVGNENIIDGRRETTQTLPFLTGARLGGGGQALAIVTPRRLVDVVKCVKIIVDANCVIMPQGANTGLTGGSVPRTETGDKRPVVIISMRHLDSFFPIDGGKRVVCMAGAGLATLSRKIPEWFPDRESHSILGSTFLNPTAAAGVALGSGGTQLRKGPAYTDRAMYVKVTRNKFGENIVEVVNKLGIHGVEDRNFPEGKGSAVEQLDAYQLDVKEGYTRAMATSSDSRDGKASAHDRNYASQVCKYDHNVSRYNANCSGSECNRSEGKVLILATVHDTFPQPAATKTFWISFKDLETALNFRREVCLANPDDLPVSVEYMDRDTFDVVDQAGRAMASVIKVIGLSGAMLRTLWNAKLWVESLPFSDAHLWCDTMLFRLNPIFPSTLPTPIMEAGKKMDHHVAITIGEFGTGNMDRILDRLQSFASKNGRDKILIYECKSASEVLSMTAFRFVAAPAFRTWCVGEGVQGISVDYALPKNGGQTPQISSMPLKRMRYSHFGCNVVHEDLAFPPDADAHAAKMELKMAVEHDCQGKLPAEHGHGTEYEAPPETKERWKHMDPLNIFNPGVGGLSYKEKYEE
jgi:D-lactate dehydrogenase (quinone)